MAVLVQSQQIQHIKKITGNKNAVSAAFSLFKEKQTGNHKISTYHSSYKSYKCLTAAFTILEARAQKY